MSRCGVVPERLVARHSDRSFLVLHHDDSRKMRASPTEPYTGHGGQLMWAAFRGPKSPWCFRSDRSNEAKSNARSSVV